MRELMSYLPESYAASTEVASIQSALEPELQLIWAARDDLLLQLDPNTATWGLEYWENAFGLPAPRHLTSAERRSRVVARIRGFGTTTVAVLQSVVEAFCPGCDVIVIEHYGDYVVEIGITMITQGLEDVSGLNDILKLIMPAHLGWGYSYTIKVTGGISYGICSEMAGVMEIWPQMVTCIRSVGGVEPLSALECQGVIEIYPEGGVLDA